MSDQADRPNKRNIFNSPLTNIIISFILTGVVGTVLTQHFFDRRQDEQWRATELEHRQEALAILIQQLKEYQVRFEVLIEALQRGATLEEAKKYKDAYDESWIAWRMHRPRLLVLIGDMLSRSEYERFLLTLESQMHEGRIAPIRRCVNEVFAEIEDTNRVKEVLADCNIDEKVKKAINCIDAIYSELHEITLPSGTNAGIDDERRAELTRQVHDACTD